MTINIAQLVSAFGSRQRFLWKQGSSVVAIVQYDKTGSYEGSRKIGMADARAKWDLLVVNGWKRVKPKSGVGEALTPNDKALILLLS